jgi:hypothetical protein
VPLPFFGQGPADVIDGEILFAQGDDLLAPGIAAGILSWRPAGRKEKVPVGILAKLVTKDTETARGVAKLERGPRGRETLDEEGSEGLVLAVDRVFGFQEEGSEVC